MGIVRARPAAAVALAVAIAWLGFYAGWLLLAPGSDRTQLVFADTAYLVPIVAAALLSAWAVSRVPSGLRGFWLLVSVGCASWAVGEGLWSYAELGSGAVPFPWWSDAFYLGFYAAMLAALVVFFRPSFRVIGGQALLDGFLAAASLALLWWWLVLRDVALGTDLASLVALGYPVLDFLLLAVIATTPLLAARRGTLAGWLVAAAVATGGIADGLYAGRALEGSYVSGGLLDLGWQLEACLICLGAVASALGVGRRPGWQRRRSPVRLRTAWSMSAALVVVVLVLGVDGARGSLTSGAVALASALAALLLLRGWFLLLAATRDAARRDPHTGVYDEPHLRDQLRRLSAAARQYQDPFALVLMRVPRRAEDGVVDRLVRTARELDIVARRADGGLAVVLSRTGDSGAAEAAERLRRVAGDAASAGVAVWRSGDTGETMMRRASTLLDAATRLGGNHTRGPEPDVLLRADDGLGPEALGQLLRLATAIDARYRIAPAHSRKVAQLARDLALALELGDEAVAAAYLGGLLHAFGTLPLGEDALHPQGALAPIEAKIELHHGSRGADLVRRIPCAAHVAPVVGMFEEQWDGSGPRRVRGESIPFPARVVGVANAVVTMTEPLGDALPLTAALSEIWRLAGGRFDPEVVSALFRLVRDGSISEALDAERLVV